MGFSEATFGFLRDIEAHNSREWFEANRASYETHWKEAALDVIAELSEDMAALSPSLKAVPKLNGSLRRINRDVRFSKDKSPYNARLHMIFWTGDHPNRSPAMHLVLTPEGVGYGAGQFGLEPAALKAVRERIIDGEDGDALLTALKSAEAVGCTMGPPGLARLPKGFEAEGPRAELLRHKAVVARTRGNEAPASVVTGSGARQWIMETTSALMPLIAWLHGR